jgi:hypothetical protein
MKYRRPFALCSRFGKTGVRAWVLRGKPLRRNGLRSKRQQISGGALLCPELIHGDEAVRLVLLQPALVREIGAGRIVGERLV